MNFNAMMDCASHWKTGGFHLLPQSNNAISRCDGKSDCEGRDDEEMVVEQFSS